MTASRRDLLLGLAGTIIGSSSGAAAYAGPIGRERRAMRYAYVGCRTTRDRNARGDGLAIFRIDPSNERWTLQQTIACENPSYLAFDRTGTMLYAVHGDLTEISSFRVKRSTGEISFVNKSATHGRNPVHLAVDPSNRFLVVANHITDKDSRSNVAVLPLRTNGSLGDVLDTLELPGGIGPHRIEQPFSKPHQCLFDPSGKFIVVPDKGLDRIFSLTLDKAGKLGLISSATAIAREGSGPRHVIFHPSMPYLFVLNELSSTVMCCGFEASTGKIIPRQEVLALPESFVPANRAAEIDISPDGHFVYVSNRGSDTIGAFAFDVAAGRLKPVEWVPCLGEIPRFFSLGRDGAIHVANEGSDTIVRFDRSLATGRLTSGRVVAKTGSPTCILFV